MHIKCLEMYNYSAPAPQFIPQTDSPHAGRKAGCRCCIDTLVLAKRLGLEPHQDTIAIAYGRDGVLAVPRFKDDRPAFFGDFSINNR